MSDPRKHHIRKHALGSMSPGSIRTRKHVLGSITCDVRKQPGSISKVEMEALVLISELPHQVFPLLAEQYPNQRSMDQ